MKTISHLTFLTLLFFSFSCSSQSPEQQASSGIEKPGKASGDSAKLEAYYFHFTARCVTCRTIEADAKKNLEALYPEETRAGLITFQSLNLDEEPARAIAKQLGISGQTLLLVRGDQKINITNEGFMYAIPKPEKFKQILKEKVKFLLSR